MKNPGSRRSQAMEQGRVKPEPDSGMYATSPCRFGTWGGYGRSTVSLILANALLLSSQTVCAQVWQQSVAVPTSLEYDTNPALSPVASRAIWRARFVPRYRAMGVFGASELNAEAALNVERSSDTAISMDREDPSFLVGWRRATETSELAASARYAEASTRVTELEDTGLLATDATRKTRSILASWRKALSQRSSVVINADHADVSYSGGGLTDYSNTTAGAAFGYALNDQAELTARASASHYEPDSAILRASSSYSALIGLKWRFTERLDGSFEAGATRIEGATDDANWLGGAKLRYVNERSELNLDMGRSFGASGEGGYAETDQFRISWGYAVDERTRAGVDMTWRDYKGVSPSTNSQIGLWATRELTPLWNARLYCQFKNRDANSVGDASATVIGITLIYVHPDL